MLNCIIFDNDTKIDSLIIENMFRLRHKVFCEQRQWVAIQEDGMERDVYDALPLVYVVVVDASKRVLGCLRMKSTSGPYMLKDIFPILAPDIELPTQPDIWEISRFSVDETLIEHRTISSVSLVANIMLQAIFKYARQQDITQLVGVTDIVFERLLRRAGMYTIRYSPPRRIGNCIAVAGYADTTDALIRTLEERGREIRQSEKNHKPNFVIGGLAA